MTNYNLIKGEFGCDNSQIKYEGVNYYKTPGLRIYVSKRGTIVSYTARGNEVFQKPIYKTRSGYEQIHYCGKMIYVHRLVAFTFGLIDELDVNLDIDHINNIRCDNRLSNLQAITHADNIKKRDVNGNANDKQLYLLKYDVNTDKAECLYFKSCREAAEYLVSHGTSKTTIQNTRENLSRRNKPYGYYKLFIDDIPEGCLGD